MTTVLSQKDPNEIYPLTADFTASLAKNESVASVHSVTCEVISGTDPDAANMLQGSAVMEGNKVKQAIRNGVVGATYLVRVTVVTSAGNRYAAGGQFSVARAGT